MQTNSVLVTAANLVQVSNIFSNTHVTYVANSNVFLTEDTVYVAANVQVNSALQNACISNVLYN